MTNAICKIISDELKCDIQMRIAATLHLTGVSCAEWNDLGFNPATCKYPWVMLPEPDRNAIRNHLSSLEKFNSIIGKYDVQVEFKDIPQLPILAKKIENYKSRKIKAKR